MSATQSKSISVLGSNIHYLEAGMGDPILFLHGIPASSYLWRNIIPHLSGLGRCIAPDLIGYGESGKPDIEYSIFDHINYIDAFIEALKLTNITIVMHGWGSLIGCHYLAQMGANCKGLVLYEPFLHIIGDDEKSLPFIEQATQWQANIDTQTKLAGKDIIAALLQHLTMQALSPSELAHYQQPFSTAESIKPILQYINELPTGTGNSKIDKLIVSNTNALARSTIPKLMLYSIPGFMTTMAAVMWAKEHIPNLEIADIGEELHFGQESHSALMGEIISAWLQGSEQL